jgi:hypothetical protein
MLVRPYPKTKCPGAVQTPGPNIVVITFQN